MWQRIKAVIQKIVNNALFNRVVIFLLAINLVILALLTFPDIKTSSFGAVLYILDDTILYFFVCEIIMRIIAEKLRYFKDGWNVFDFTVVAIAFLGSGGAGISALRVFRALRLFRLISLNKSFKRIIDAFFLCMRGVASVFSIALIVNLVFAIIACEFLGNSHPELFGNVFKSIYSLAKLSMMFTWADIAGAAGAEDSPLTAIFFMIYFVINAYVLFNLVIAIVCEAYYMLREGDEEEKEQVVEADPVTDEINEKIDLLAKANILEQKIDNLLSKQRCL